jgi:hypothetical protein
MEKYNPGEKSEGNQGLDPISWISWIFGMERDAMFGLYKHHTFLRPSWYVVLLLLFAHTLG